MPEESCCDDEIPEGFPDAPPPCSANSCSVVWESLRNSGGMLMAKMRLRGGSGARVVDVDDDCGVLRCFTDDEGTAQGVDVDLFGDPATLEAVDCEDEDGNSLYVNPVRRIRNADGSCSLGAIPFPIQNTICSSVTGCETLAPEGEEGDIYSGCAAQVCATIENPSCFPMNVVPTLTLEGAQLGAAPVTYEIQANHNGNFDSKIPMFSSAGKCSVSHVPGDSVGHSVDCGESRETQSTTFTFPLVEIVPGASYTVCVTPSVRYDAGVEGPFTVDYGELRLCLAGASKVTPETIAALGGN